jgi:uncharacterized protein (DUF486 family)
MSQAVIKTFALLLTSTLIMNVAWYGHLFLKERGAVMPYWKAFLISWGLIAMIEYIFLVWGNRTGHDAGFDIFELKVIAESFALMVFLLLIYTVGGYRAKPDHLIAFALIISGLVYGLKEKLPFLHGLKAIPAAVQLNQLQLLAVVFLVLSMVLFVISWVKG